MFSLPILALLLAFSSISLAFPTHPKLARQANTTAAATPPRLVVYIQTFHDTAGNPLSLLPLLTEQTGVTHIYLSSLHLNANPGDITLNDDPPNATMYDTLWSEVAQLQQNGIKVMAMLGGAAQGSYQRLSGDDASFQTYYTPLLALLRAHSLDGLDLDIEEAVPLSTPLRLLHQLTTDLGPSFLLTLAPVASALTPSGPSLSNFSYFDLDAQASDPTRSGGKLVNWYNAQFYNGWGDASSVVNYNTIISSGGWAPERVVMGVLANPNDGGSGFVALETLKSVISQLRANYGTFGCAVGWEYWDAGAADGLEQPWEWVQQVGSAVFGAVEGEADVRQDFTQGGDLKPQTPWQGGMEKLLGEGAEWWEAQVALNRTGGDVWASRGRLGLGERRGRVERG